MTDARAWLDQVDARTNAATDGPWEWNRTYPLGPHGPYSTSVRSPQVTISDGLTKRDAEFIAHARTDLPAATTALRAVLDLHADDGYGDCTGCGVDTYENAISWPCSTVTAITTALSQEDA